MEEIAFRFPSFIYAYEVPGLILWYIFFPVKRQEVIYIRTERNS